MVYGLIPKVRKLAGISAVREHTVQIGVGDGIETVFQIPSVANRQSFFVDKDAATSSTISVDDDVIAYSNGSTTPITSIDQDSGKITLTNPPASDVIVTADYGASEVSDQDVIEAMEIAEEMTDEIIRGKNSADRVSFEVTDTIIYADASPDTATRASGSWLDDGLIIGDKVIILGSANNDGTYTISSLSATVLTIDASENFPTFEADPTDTTFSVRNVFTQDINGDGKTVSFAFEHADVTTINSVTVNNVIKVIDTNYKLYKFKGDLTRYWYIHFKQTPRNDLQNISVDYGYGETKKGITRMAEYFAARYILLEIKPSRATGYWVKGDKLPEKGEVSRLPQIIKELKSLMLKYDRRIKYATA
ncbi:hypothetical protein LCGC14_0821770 [marine sediment metagenome]|uniref:Uncharacterized protein n=1 Tax=marine sediment metagenome TaxID=412755 RepID=A0A0F9PN82_9ZZZZ